MGGNVPEQGLREGKAKKKKKCRKELTGIEEGKRPEEWPSRTGVMVIKKEYKEGQKEIEGRRKE
jgi:hypothetical protein